jgi:homocysteine S-methyltransferase
MGSMIYANGIYINQSYDNLNLARPHLIKNIHQQYLQAGAEVLETNTFGATRGRLGGYGLGDKVREINLAGARLAREAAQEGRAWVAGSIGPLTDPLTPHGPLSHGDARAQYREQVQALLDGEVDIVHFESFDQLEMLEEAVRSAREVDPDIPIVAQLRFGNGKETQYGQTAEQCAERLTRLPIDVIGTNCAGAEEVLDAVERLHRACELPISAQPNLGYPKQVEDRILYLATPEYLMEYTRRMVHHGARVLGACCGSTPDHLRSIRSSVRMVQPQESAQEGSQASVGSGESAIVIESPRESRKLTAAGAETPSRLAATLRAGRFAVSVEIDPPVGTDPAKSLEAAAVCRDAGVDCINIADGPRATARMGPVDMALLLLHQVGGVEPIVHFCCRDRNLLGMQADLIGANALEIYNILVITGDPPKLGDYPFATAVYDVDAVGALRIASNLNSGKDLADNPLRGPATRLFLGCGANPGAIDLDTEIERLERKIENGAEYILTQPVYDTSRFESFYSRIGHIKIPILLGVLPLASYRNAEFLTREVPGMEVPQPILERMRRWEDKESARKEGIAIAQEALAAGLPFIQGTYIMPPFNRVDSALQVLEVLPEEKRPRPRSG